MNTTQPRFSRKALNVLIVITALLILVFSQMGPDEQEPQLEKVAVADIETVTASDASKKKESITDFFPELKNVPEIPKAGVNLKIQRWETEEGLPVYFSPSPELPMVDVRLVFDGGSARDPKGKEGLASLTSNLLQLSAKGITTSQVAQKFESLGAEMSTSSYRDFAVASLRVLSEEDYLAPGLELFSRVVSEVEFADEDFLREINRQKIGISRKKQSPRALVGDAMFDVLYGVDHPYGISGSGTLESISSVVRADIKQFHHQYFVAENGLLAIVGNVSRQRAEQIADSVSVNFKPGARAAVLSRQTKQVNGVHQHIQFESDQTHLALIGPGLYRGHTDYYALFLTNHIIGGSGFASLLNKTIRQEKAFAYSVSSSASPMAAIGSVSIQMQTRADQAAAAIAATQQVIDRVVKKGLDESVLSDAKQQILSEFAMRAASNSSQLGYLGMIGFYGLPLDYLETLNENVSRITEQDVRRMVAKYFENMAVVTLGSIDPLSVEGNTLDVSTDEN